MRMRTRSSIVRINNLNDDCLLRVFENVDVTDIFSLEAVCRRWRNLCPLVWKNIRSFDVTDAEQLGYAPFLKEEEGSDINVALCKPVFSRCFLYLTEVNLSRCHLYRDNTLINFGHYSCESNILRSKLRSTLETAEQKTSGGTLCDLRIPLATCENIQKLLLCRCVLECDDEYLGRIFENNKKLRFLALSNYQLSGKCVTHLSFELIESIVFFDCDMSVKYLNLAIYRSPKLHTLKLDRTSVVDELNENDRSQRPSTPVNLLRLSFESSFLGVLYLFDYRLLKRLICLNLSSVDLQDYDLEIITRNCTELRLLDVSNNYDLTDVSLFNISLLPNLENLDISSGLFTDEGLQALSEVDLKVLDVSTVDFSGDGLLTLVQKMQNLEELFIGNLWHLDHSFIRSVADIVTTRSNKTSLIIGVFPSPIDTSLINDLSPCVKVIAYVPSLNYNKYV